MDNKRESDNSVVFIVAQNPQKDLRPYVSAAVIDATINESIYGLIGTVGQHNQLHL